LALSETALLDQCRRGNANAFERLVAQYEKKVYNLAFRMVGNHEDASDIAQEAFLKVYTSLDQFRGESSFSTWLYRVVSNACLDELRRRARHRVVSIDTPVSVDDPSPRQIPSNDPEPGHEIEKAEVQTAVQEGIKELPDDHRIILVLRDIQGLSYEEIAQVLDMPLGTVKSRLNRARLGLRDRLLGLELFSTLGVRTGERGESR